MVENSIHQITPRNDVEILKKRSGCLQIKKL